MDHLPPEKLIEALAGASVKKAALSARDLLLRGFLAGVFLGYATSFAYRVAEGFTGGAAALVAAAVFPVGFALIALLGMELVTGNFAVLPAGVAAGRIGVAAMLRNWGWVFLGNLAGSVFYALLLAVSLTAAFTHAPDAPAEKIIAVARAKTFAYEQAGAAGWLTAFTKAVLCNWMVTLGAVLAFSSTSTAGKIAALWLPIMTFFALAFEHSVVNMFVIPAAMLLDADIGVARWWWWNQIPVTLGNLLSGALFTGWMLYYTHAVRARRSGACDTRRNRTQPANPVPARRVQRAASRS